MMSTIRGSHSVSNYIVVINYMVVIMIYDFVERDMNMDMTNQTAWYWSMNS